MERKLWETLGFTIAEIIVAVAITAALVTVLMKGLQSLRKSLQKDLYEAEVDKRLLLVRSKVEAAFFNGDSPDKRLTNIGLTEEEKKDPLGQDYTFKYIKVAHMKRGSGQTKKVIFLFTGSKLKDLGIISEEITFYL